MKFNDVKKAEFKEIAEALFDLMNDPSRPADGSMNPSREKAMQACEKAIARIDDDIAKPMSSKAAKYIELLDSMSSVDKGSINAGIMAYGDNHLAYKAICEIANNSGIHIRRASSDEIMRYVFSEIKRTCFFIEFGDGDIGKLTTVLSDWANNLQGYESLLGNKTGLIVIPSEQVA